MKNKVSLEHTPTTLVTFLVVLICLLGFSFWMVKPFMLAIVVGAILALLTRPLFEKLRKRGVFPKLAAMIVTIALILLVIIPLSIFLSLAVKQAMGLAHLAAETDAPSIQSLVSALSKSPLFEITGSSPEDLNQRILDAIQSAGKLGMALALSVVSALPNLVLQIVLACIACFFFLIDGARLVTWLSDKVPLDRDIRTRIAKSFRDTAVSSVWATLAAGVAQSIVIFLGFLILGVPGVFLAAGTTFIFSWIPILGSSPVWITGVIYLLNHGSPGSVFAMVIFGLGAGVVDNIVRPMVLKGRDNMHPLVSLVAIFGGIGFFGIVGVFVGPILAAVSISILQIWPAVAQRFGLMTPD